MTKVLPRLLRVIPRKYRGRKFMVTLLTILLIALNDALGLNLSPEEIYSLLGLGVGYSVGQGIVNYGKTKNGPSIP
jgi:hypothetical protein